MFLTKIEIYYFLLVQIMLFYLTKCLNEIDIKKILAFFSIIHINFMILIVNSKQNIIDVILLLSSRHCIVSRMLFFISGKIIENFNSRNILFINNNIYLSINILMFIILFLFLNFGFPPFIPFLTEISVITNFIEISSSLIIFLILSIAIIIILSIKILIQKSSKNEFKRKQFFFFKNEIFCIKEIFVITFLII